MTTTIAVEIFPDAAKPDHSEKYEMLHDLCVRLVDQVGARAPETLTGLIASTRRGIELGVADADENLRSLGNLSTFAGEEGRACIERLKSPRRAGHLRVMFVTPEQWQVFDCPMGIGPKGAA